MDGPGSKAHTFYGERVFVPMSTGEFTGVPPMAFGLCADCQHARPIESAKGSRFLLCQLSGSDPRFPKYPRLPVLRCSGYSPKPAPTRRS